jgi:hypothetical protein
VAQCVRFPVISSHSQFWLPSEPFLSYFLTGEANHAQTFSCRSGVRDSRGSRMQQRPNEPRYSGRWAWSRVRGGGNAARAANGRGTNAVNRLGQYRRRRTGGEWRVRVRALTAADPLFAWGGIQPKHFCQSGGQRVYVGRSSSDDGTRVHLCGGRQDILRVSGC